jgi:dihydroorotase
LSRIVIRNATLVNEGRLLEADVLTAGGLIERIGPSLSVKGDVKEIDAGSLHLFPGLIDDQVHFREPGLTHKGTIRTEARAAVAGGITSFMEMPNTKPPALTQALLEEKYHLAAATSLANFSFYMGVSNTNAGEVLRTDPATVCGIKIFMGSSTGDMLVDEQATLEKLFAESPLLIAVHSEDEKTIRENLEKARQRYGDGIPPAAHPEIRSAEACYLSSSRAVALAKKHGTRLHVLHVSTARETELFEKGPLEQKRITAEVCVHHLWFCDEDYERLGNRIKWNPAVKSAADREGLLKALREGRLDVVATDHAPHTAEEKNRSYAEAPSGGPLVQHALPALLELYHLGKITLPEIAAKTSHDVARCFRVKNRGFLREGYAADLVLVNLDAPWTVDKASLLYHCGWSPFEGQRFRSCITHTLVNGRLVYDNGAFDEEVMGRRLAFERS